MWLVVSVTPRPRIIPEEGTPCTYSIGGWVGPKPGLDAEARREMFYKVSTVEQIDLVI
jgi:hypothetical protein